MRKDILAAGARSAKFAGGFGEGSGPSVMSDEDRAKLEAETAAVIVEKTAAPKKIFRPRGTTLLVRRVNVEELSTIINTEAIDKEKPSEGTIVAAGPMVQSVTQGHHIVFGKYAGTEFRLNGELLLIMDEDDVKGTLEEEMLRDESGNWANVGGCLVGRT